MAAEGDVPTFHHIPTRREPSTLAAVPDDEPGVDREELRQLEPRTDARFQGVSARFTMVDRRYAGLGERVEGLEVHARSADERSGARDKTIDGRFDATDARIDLVHDNLAAKINESSRRQGRLFLYAVGVTGAVVAVDVVVEVAAWLLR